MYGRSIAGSVWLIAMAFSTDVAIGQFTSIINVPPDPAPGSIQAGTQINVFDDGLLPSRFDLFDLNPGGEINFFGGGAGSNFNVNGATVNLYEGSIGIQMEVNGGSTMNIAGGAVGIFFEANRDSIVNITGGRVGFAGRANAGSIVNISGGIIDSAFNAEAGSRVTISGGYVTGGLRSHIGSQMTLSGGVIGDDFKAWGALRFHGDDFAIDGQPVPGLAAIDDEVQVSLPLMSQFTGTFADGSPFSFSYLDDDDQLQNASITLVRTALPAVEAHEIRLPADAAPAWVRAGQTLILEEGAAIGDDFHAGAGSRVLINGGTIGENFEAVGAQIDMEGGSIGRDFGLFNGSVLKVRGANIDGFRPLPGSIADIAGGVLGDTYAHDGAEIVIRGGTQGGTIWARGDSKVVVHGDDFRLNGSPLPDLDEIGDSVALDPPATFVLTGTLNDGTPFAFSSQDHDQFEPGTLSLVRSNTPPIEAAAIMVPGSPVPRGVRAGQTLFLEQGGELGEHFNAGSGSAIEIRGGSIGDNLEAVGAKVHLIDGEIGQHADAFAGSSFLIEGGRVGQSFHAGDGAVVRIGAGEVGGNFSAAEDASVIISGGTVGGLSALAGAHVTIRGGTIVGFYAHDGAAVELIGTQFSMNGMPIAGLENPGNSLVLPNRNGETLRVRLLDGTTKDFILRVQSRGDVGNFAPNSMLRLTLAVPEPSAGLLVWTAALIHFCTKRKR